MFGTTIPDAKLAFSGDGQSGSEAEVSERRLAADTADTTKDVIKDAIKQAVDQAVLKLSIGNPGPMNEKHRRRSGRTAAKRNPKPSGSVFRAPFLVPPFCRSEAPIDAARRDCTVCGGRGLALALIGYAVRPYLRRAERRPPGVATAELAPPPREPSRPPAGHGCPACHRDYAPGLRFCPHDARDLVPASDPAARAAGAGSTCPTCRRSYDAGKKFCAFDGEELVPLPSPSGPAVRPAPRFRRRAGQNLPQLLAAVRERGHVLRARRRRAGPGE